MWNGDCNSFKFGFKFDFASSNTNTSRGPTCLLSIINDSLF